MNAQLKVPTMQPNTSAIQYAPLSEFFLSELNVRKGKVEDGISELADSIFAEGVLQNLVCYLEPVEGSHQSHKGVTAGGRRWRALQLLLKNGRISPDYPVPFKPISKEAAIATSLAENSERLELSPADEFQAAQAMQEDGLSIEAIADRLRIEPIRVLRRLKLAKVAPEFIEDLRAKKISLEQVMALAATDDHDRQRTVWKGLPDYQRDPRTIRRMVLQGEIAASSPLARFVTIKAYEKAGGGTRKDLFSEDEGVFVLDRPLLTELAQSKLSKKAVQLKKEKHAFVHVHVGELDPEVLAAYGRVRMVERPMTQEETSQLGEFSAELDQLEKNLQDQDPDSAEYKEMSNRADATEKSRDFLMDSLWVPSAEQATKAGALVGIDKDGNLRIERGLLLAEDAKLFAEQEKRVLKAGVGGVEKRQHSMTLLARLTSERTHALRAEFVQHPEVALAALIDRLWCNTIDKFSHGDPNPLQIVSPERDLNLDGAAQSKSRAGVFLDERRQFWRSKLDDRECSRFEAILRLPLSEKLELLALGASGTLDAIQRSEAPSSADALAKELGFDLRRWWSPTAENYFNNVSKQVILGAARECLPAEQIASMEVLKKAELAKRAEQLLSGSGWIPGFLRADRVIAEAHESDEGSDEESEDLTEESAEIG
jgi:ParB family chromosome partitioning protein